MRRRRGEAQEGREQHSELTVGAAEGSTTLTELLADARVPRNDTRDATAMPTSQWARQIDLPPTLGLLMGARPPRGGAPATRRHAYCGTAFVAVALVVRVIAHVHNGVCAAALAVVDQVLHVVVVRVAHVTVRRQPRLSARVPRPEREGLGEGRARLERDRGGDRTAQRTCCSTKFWLARGIGRGYHSAVV